MNRKVSDETKLKQSLAKQGAKNPNYGKKSLDSTKKKISDAMRKYWLSIPILDASKWHPFNAV